MLFYMEESDQRSKFNFGSFEAKILHISIVL